MTLTGFLWLAAGVLAGAAHAASLWLAARRPAGIAAAVGVLRLLALGILFVGAGYAGGLVPACIGWGAGFVGLVGYFLLGGRAT